MTRDLGKTYLDELHRLINARQLFSRFQARLLMTCPSRRRHDLCSSGRQTSSVL